MFQIKVEWDVIEKTFMKPIDSPIIAQIHTTKKAL